MDFGKIRKVIVGSANPAKVGAVREALEKLWPEAKFSGVEVESGVSKQPMSDEETLRGARNRARAVLTATDADVAVGLEGGAMETKEGMMNVVWCVILIRDGPPAGGESFSGGSHFLLPKGWSEKLKAGQEISDILEEMTGDRDLHKKGGMIGLLTKNLTSRRAEYAQLVRLATIKLMHPEWY